MTREEQIRSAAYEASMTEETIMREEVIKDGVHIGYKDIKLRDSDRPIARLFFMEGVKWADANPCMPDKVVKIPKHSREEIKELLANWKGTLVVGDDISPSPWISVENGLPELNNYGETKMVFVRVINKDTKAEWIEQPAKYNANIKDWIAMDFTHIGKRNGIVTHWMPIPELPKEEKK